MFRLVDILEWKKEKKGQRNACEHHSTVQRSVQLFTMTKCKIYCIVVNEHLRIERKVSKLKMKQNFSFYHSVPSQFRMYRELNDCIHTHTHIHTFHILHIAHCKMSKLVFVHLADSQPARNTKLISQKIYSRRYKAVKIVGAVQWQQNSK